MNQDVFNMQTRRFLNKVGIQSQREIEQAVHQGIVLGIGSRRRSDHRGRDYPELR